MEIEISIRGENINKNGISKNSNRLIFYKKNSILQRISNYKRTYVQAFPHKFNRHLSSKETIVPLLMYENTHKQETVTTTFEHS